MFKRAFLAVVAVSFVLPSVAAGAGHGTESAPAEAPQGYRVPYVFAGHVVSVDVDASTLTAEVRTLNGPSPQSEKGVHTFITDEQTQLIRNAAPASLGDFRRGDHVAVVILAPHAATLEEVLATPARMIAGHWHPDLYGFAGRVSDVDPAEGTVTLTVQYASKAGRRVLDGASSRRLTFQTDEETRIWKEGEESSLAEIENGDLAGVGILAPDDASLEEVLATPAAVVVDVGKQPQARPKHEGREARKKQARQMRKAIRAVRREVR